MIANPPRYESENEIPLTQDEINRYITEKILNLCWHERSGKRTTYNLHLKRFYDIEMFNYICAKCGNEFLWNHYDKRWRDAPNFSLWQHYGPMLEKCMEKEWWNDFKTYLSVSANRGGIDVKVDDILFNPAHGSRAIVEFLKRRE